MTEEIAKSIFNNSLSSNSPETYIKQQSEIHKYEGKAYWEYMLKEVNKSNYPKSLQYIKPRLVSYCEAMKSKNKEQFKWWNGWLTKSIVGAIIIASIGMGIWYIQQCILQDQKLKNKESRELQQETKTNQ